MMRKFSGFRPDNGRPELSVTTAGTETSCVSTLTTSPSSTSLDDAGGAFFGSAVCSEPVTRRGRCAGCCVICCAATHTDIKRTIEPGKRRQSLVINCIATKLDGLSWKEYNKPRRGTKCTKSYFVSFVLFVATLLFLRP